MRRIAIVVLGLVVFTGISCYRRAPDPYNPAEHTNVEYWLSKMQGVQYDKLSEPDKRYLAQVLDRAGKQLQKAGTPAADRIAVVLKEQPGDRFFQLHGSMVLYKISGTEAAPDIAGALMRTSIEDDPVYYFRLCHYLARDKRPEVLPVLMRLLENRKTSVRMHGTLGKPLEINPRQVCILLFGAYGTKSITPVQNACSSSDPIVRTNAVAVLGYFCDDQPLFVLADLLRNDPDPLVRQEAAKALGRINHIAAVRPIAEVLTADKDSEVRTACAYALGVLDQEECIEPLTLALNDFSASVRQMAATSLMTIGTQQCATAIANRLAIEQETVVRLTLIKSLGVMGQKNALPVLNKLQDSSTNDEALAATQSAKRIIAFGPPSKEPYDGQEGSDVSDAVLQRMVDGLCQKHGEGLNDCLRTIYLSARLTDLPLLEEMRRSVLYEINYQTVDRSEAATKLIRMIKRRERGIEQPQK